MYLMACTGKPVAKIMASFTLQGGVPLIKVGVPTCQNGVTRFTLSQSRFGLDAASKTARLWQVPVRLNAGAGAADVVVSGATPMNASVKGCGPLIVNAGQTAYFRTLYSPTHFDRLRSEFAGLSLDDQVGILGDAYSLANGGYQPVDRYLSLIASLKADAPPLVWTLAASQLAGIDDRIKGGAEQAPFRARALALLRPVFGRVGWEAKSGEAPAVAQLREQIIPLLGQFGDAAIREAEQLMSRFAALLRLARIESSARAQ